MDQSINTGFAVGGPYGVAVGTGFLAGEVAYDAGKEVKKEFGIQLNQYYRTLIGGWLNSR